MKMTPSILVAELSGSSAGVTASRWKGRPYFRARVTPSNPKTEDQVLQRRFFTRAVNYWQALSGTRPDIRSPWETGQKMFLDTLGAPLSLSGYNVSCRQTIKDLVAEIAPRVIPISADRPTVENFEIQPGDPGEIAVSWTAGQAAPTDKLWLFVGLKSDQDEYPDSIILLDDPRPLVSALSCTITDLVEAADYAILAIVGNETNELYSVGQWDFAAAG